MNIEMKSSLLLLCGLAAGTAASAAEPRPNILWLTFEDTSPDFIGCYGNEAAKTPNMDALAETGTRFEGAFSTGAVSSPSRFCLITGVRAFSAGNGNHRSSYPVPQGWEGFPYYLRQSGYYTSNNFKMDYSIQGAKHLAARAWDANSVTADWRGRRPGQPFFAVFNSMSSHQSRTMTDPWDEYENKILSKLDEDEKTAWGELPMPAVYRDSPQMQKCISRVYNSITKTDKEFGEWLKKLEADGLRDSTIIFCFSDHGEGIPRGKSCALSMGYRVPFIVWIPPMYAHLSPYGSGIVTEELVSFEDFAPTVLSLAGAEIPERMEGKPFLGEKRGTPKKYVFSGVDRVGENTELSRSVTDGRYLYTRSFIPYQPFVRWMIYFDVSEIQSQIRSDYAAGKLNPVQASLLRPRDVEYLYDIRNDQWETVNLAGDKKYAEKLKELREVLRKQIIATRDAGFIPEYLIMAASKRKQAPYDLRLDEKIYPVERVVATAYLSGRGQYVVPRQISALDDPSEIVRYWAAVGLFSQKSDLKKQVGAIEAAYAKATDPLVRVYLEAVLVGRCGRMKYLGRFLENVGNPEPEVVRTTLQLVMNMSPEVRQAAVPVVEKCVADKTFPRSCNGWRALLRHDVKNAKLPEIRSQAY